MEPGGSVTFYEILVNLSLILWIVASVTAIFGMLALLPRVLKAFGQIESVSDEFRRKAIPVLDQSQQLLDQVGTMATSLVDDVERIDRTVIRTTTSVESMVELAEDRVSEINALLEVAVEEAEETFFSTAAIMRALRLGGRGRKRRGMSRAERRRLG
jgi:phage-related protein